MEMFPKKMKQNRREYSLFRGFLGRKYADEVARERRVENKNNIDSA